jgi:hypothetical protein
MYKISKDRNKVLDYNNKIVGFIVDGRFSQYRCDPFYRVGLTPMELEKISELMQRTKLEECR